MRYLFALAVALVMVPMAAPTAATASPTAPEVSVQGHQIVDADGNPLRLRGVNRSGSEYACVQGWGFFDGPVDASTLTLIASWGSNAVRVPLNAQCWLNINGVPAAYSGQAYRDQIRDFVDRINAAGMVAIVDLHWNAPGTNIAYSQQVMADADHAPAFWASVAATFAGYPSVVFDLYNEPHDISWACWRDGCRTNEGWEAAGMQDLVDAVRATGATNLVIASGLNWAGDLSEWILQAPVDPLDNLAAGVHIYSFSQCNTESCWNSTIGDVAKTYPVVSTEIGEDTCTGTFTSTYMTWADANGVGYLPWAWNTADCRSGPSLITNYNGTPTTYGAAVRAHMTGLAAGTTLYGFGSLRQSWVSTASITSGKYAHMGRRSMQVSKQLVPSKRARAFTHNDNEPVDPSNGSALTAWIRLDPRSPRGDWHGRLTMRDESGRWVNGPAVQLRRGQWTPVTYSPAASVWQDNSGIGVRVVGSTGSDGRLFFQVDSVTQN